MLCHLNSLICWFPTTTLHTLDTLHSWMSIRPKSAFWLCFDLDPKVGDYVVLKKCQETDTQRFAISNK